MEYKSFEKRISDIVASLEAEIQRFAPVYLMSLLNQKVIHSIAPSALPSELPDGFAQKFHYICGLIASRPLPHVKIEPGDSGNLEHVLALTDQLFNEYTTLWITRPSLGGSREVGEVQRYGAGLTSFLSALHQPKLGSTEQFIQFTLEQFEAFDDRFLIPQKGITTRQCVDVFLAITNRVRAQYEACVEDFAGIMKPAMESWKQFCVGEITLDEARRRAMREPLSGERLNDNASKFMASFTVSKGDFLSDFPQSVLDAFFAIFSFEPGSINKGFRYPTDLNELDVKPLMQLEAERSYVTEVTRVFLALPIALSQMLTSSKHVQSFFKHRDQLAQRKTAELLGKVFPNDTIIEEAYYGYDNDMEFETDLLIPYGRTLLICEVKAKALRDPLYTEGNIQKIEKDFQVSIQAAYSQALRTRNYILSQESASFVDKKRRPLAVLRRDELDDYLLMVVTAESFGSLATDLSFLLEKERDDPYPMTISLFDLELLVTRLNSPDKFLDYASQRRQLHGSVYTNDELDFAGYYLRYGNLDFSAQLKGRGVLVLDGSFARVFDEDWYEAHGFKIEKGSEANGPYFSVIKRHGDEITLGVEGLPETFETIRLDEETTTKSISRRKRPRRNAPCPCGSGKKYKKCCGKPKGQT
jgi:hypothetical protein